MLPGPRPSLFHDDPQVCSDSNSSVEALSEGPPHPVLFESNAAQGQGEIHSNPLFADDPQTRSDFGFQFFGVNTYGGHPTLRFYETALP